MGDRLLQCIKSKHFQEMKNLTVVTQFFVKLRKFNFRSFVTADFLGHCIIPKTKI